MENYKNIYKILINLLYQMKSTNIENIIPNTENFAPFTEFSEINLPDPIEFHTELISSSTEELTINLVRLREGCYLIRYSPIGPITPTVYHYDGTLRVQLDGSNIIASGDLYFHRILPPIPFTPEPTPSSTQIIPMFKRANYRYYIRVTGISRGRGIVPSIIVDFERYRFSAPNTWINEGKFSANMSRIPAPMGYPSSSDYYTGLVTDSLGTNVGNLTMGWVSEYFRRATIEMDSVRDSELAVVGGTGITWNSIFKLVKWYIDIKPSNIDVPAPTGPSWSNADVHKAMLTWRDSSDLDSEWRYHLLHVHLLNSTPRGIMYDVGGTDSNNVPREGAAIASHWIFPNSDPWGHVKGVRFGTALSPYFRTAVHEIGHAMNLKHNTIDNGIMNTTDTIAANATLPVQFPENIQWSHALDDQKRLRHLPDIFVRPGGVPFGYSYPAILPDDTISNDEDLEFKVTPELDIVPFGAPVRINYALKNNSSVQKIVPKELDMKYGHISGKVIDPSGTTRTFLPIILCLDEEITVKLNPNQSITNSATLLRGGQGHLFPLTGVYKIIVDLSWEISGFKYRISGFTNVMVTPPVDDEHAKAAYKIISNPDSLLVLVIGGDHLKEGIEAIKAGLSNPILKPHYSYIEAKRISKSFGERKPDFKTAATLLDKKTVMSPEEVKNMAKILNDSKKNVSDKTLKDIKETLKLKTSKFNKDDETRKMVETL